MTLLAAYSFDEASGDALDVTGNGHSFALGAGLTRQTGHTNTGLRHESTAANSAGPAIFGQTANRTIMCWVKRTSNSIDGWIVEMKDGVGDTGLFGFLFSGGNVQARLKNTGSTVYTVSTAQPTVNVWYHIAMTFDGSKVHLFINGTEIGTGTTTTGTLHTGATIFPFMDTVGTETVIDDVRIYDTALNAATITTAMNTPVTGASVDSATLTGSFSSATAAMTGHGTAGGTLSGSFSSATAAATGSGKASGSLAASFSSPVVAVAGTGKASGSVAASFSSPGVDISADSRVNGVLTGAFTSPTATFSGGGDLTDRGTLDGSFSAPSATFSVRSAVDVSLIGTFTQPVFSAAGGTPVVDRDILVTIGPGERPSTSIAAGPARTRVLAGDFKRTEIGA